MNYFCIWRNSYRWGRRWHFFRHRNRNDCFSNNFLNYFLLFYISIWLWCRWNFFNSNRRWRKIFINISCSYFISLFSNIIRRKPTIIRYLFLFWTTRRWNILSLLKILDLLFFSTKYRIFLIWFFSNVRRWRIWLLLIHQFFINFFLWHNW